MVSLTLAFILVGVMDHNFVAEGVASSQNNVAFFISVSPVLIQGVGCNLRGQNHSFIFRLRRRRLVGIPFVEVWLGGWHRVVAPHIAILTKLKEIFKL